MLKRLEISDPTSCLNKAAENELIFVLLERDAAAAATVRFWIQERIRLAKNKPGDPKLREAEQWAAQVEAGL